MKVLCIGSSVIETTCTMNDSLTEGMTVRLTDRVENGGGHAGNIAYLLGKWGVDTYIASMVGADDAANKIKKEYENIGVKTEYIETSYDKGTGQIVSIVNNINKNKTILEIASNSFLKKYSFNIEPDIIVSDGNDFQASSAAFDRYQKAKSFLIVTSPRKETVELSRYAKNIIFNRSTAEAIADSKIDFNNSGTLVNVYNKLKQKFSNANIIITVGERGSVYEVNGQVKIMPPMRTEIVDTNGAGAAFAGAYIYANGRDFGQERSIAYATICASLSTTKLTSRASFPTLTEVSTIYDSKYGKENNPNKTAVEIDPHVNMNTVENKEVNTTNESTIQEEHSVPESPVVNNDNPQYPQA